MGICRKEKTFGVEVMTRDGIYWEQDLTFHTDAYFLSPVPWPGFHGLGFGSCFLIPVQSAENSSSSVII